MRILGYSWNYNITSWKLCTTAGKKSEKSKQTIEEPRIAFTQEAFQPGKIVSSPFKRIKRW